MKTEQEIIKMKNNIESCLLKIENRSPELLTINYYNSIPNDFKAWLMAISAKTTIDEILNSK